MRQSRDRAELRLVDRQAQPGSRSSQHRGRRSGRHDRAARLLRRPCAGRPAGCSGSCFAIRRTCWFPCCSWKRPACTRPASARCPASEPARESRRETAATGRGRRAAAVHVSATSAPCSWSCPRSGPWSSSWCSRDCSGFTWAAPSRRTIGNAGARRRRQDRLPAPAGAHVPQRPRRLAHDFALGGLNYQIEHHLFPSMPRPSLRRAQPLVAAFCAERGLPYCQATLLGSYAQALRHLNGVGKLTRPRSPARLPPEMIAWIGTSGWSYDHWQPELYPPGLPRGSRLGRYAAAFPTAELNSSFYRWPAPSAFRSWRDRLPDGFRLSVRRPAG